MAVTVPFEVRVTFAGQDAKRAEGEVTAKFTSPARPNKLVSETDSGLEEPAEKDIDAGPVIEKSRTFTLRVALWVREPNLAIMLRV